MAEAVSDLFPDVRLAIGPPIEDGFYYDFDLGLDERGKPKTFAPEDLERIEARMQELLRQNAEFQHTTMPLSLIHISSPSERQ